MDQNDRAGRCGGRRRELLDPPNASLFSPQDYWVVRCYSHGKIDALHKAGLLTYPIQRFPKRELACIERDLLVGELRRIALELDRVTTQARQFRDRLLHADAVQLEVHLLGR